MNSYPTLPADLETQPLVGAAAPKTGKTTIFVVALVGFVAGAAVVTAAPHVAAKMSFVAAPTQDTFMEKDPTGDFYAESTVSFSQPEDTLPSRPGKIWVITARTRRPRPRPPRSPRFKTRWLTQPRRESSPRMKWLSRTSRRRAHPTTARDVAAARPHEFGSGDRIYNINNYFIPPNIRITKNNVSSFPMSHRSRVVSVAYKYYPK